LIAVLWRSGLRVSEALALALELRNVDLDQGTLRVRHGKGDKSRTVGVDDQTTALLARWLDRRRHLSPGALPHLLHPARPADRHQLCPPPIPPPRSPRRDRAARACPRAQTHLGRATQAMSAADELRESERQLAAAGFFARRRLLRELRRQAA
jgi:integrase